MLIVRLGLGMLRRKMPQHNNKRRRELYLQNKDEINRKRREKNKELGINEKKKEYEKKYREKNKEKIMSNNKSYSRKLRDKYKELVFNHYGRKCECCGEEHIDFLTIDHINGNGEKHRKEINRRINDWLVKNNFPDGFQVLCFNCNWGKHINHGICPHKL